MRENEKMENEKMRKRPQYLETVLDSVKSLDVTIPSLIDQGVEVWQVTKSANGFKIVFRIPTSRFVDGPMPSDDKTARDL